MHLDGEGCRLDQVWLGEMVVDGVVTKNDLVDLGCHLLLFGIQRDAFEGRQGGVFRSGGGSISGSN